MESSEQLQSAAAAWLARQDSDRWTDADAADLASWLDVSTARRIAYLRLYRVWNQADRLKALGAGRPAGAVPGRGAWSFAPCDWPRTPVSIPVRTARRALAAAVAIFLMGAAWLLWPLGASYRTPIGGLASVGLQDGSRMTLNTDTSVLVTQSASEREVTLRSGEAFFEVAKDPGRPFVVDAGGSRVIAVGTEFSVRRDGAEVEVVVSQGHVRLDTALLHSGEMARSSSAHEVYIVERTASEIEEALSWRTGFIAFRNVPLREIVSEFNRYNRRKLVVQDPGAAAIRVGGNFRATNLDGFVRLLQGFGIQAHQEGQTLILEKKK